MLLFLNTIYELIILCCLVFSIYKRKTGQYFHIYILSVIAVDLLFSRVKKVYAVNSNYVFFLFIIISYLYFYYFFKKNFLQKNYKRIWIGITIIFLCITLVFQIQNNFLQFSPVTMVLLPLFYIFGSMGWFTYILNQRIEGPLFDKMAFWISSGLLIWSVFFLFRGLPMYYFNKTDPGFLNEISKVFTMINIITYSLFIRSLFCKQ